MRALPLQVMLGERLKRGAVTLGLQHHDIRLAEDPGTEAFHLVAQRFDGGRFQGGFGQLQQETHHTVVVLGVQPLYFLMDPIDLPLEVGIGDAAGTTGQASKDSSTMAFFRRPDSTAKRSTS